MGRNLELMEFIDVQDAILNRLQTSGIPQVWEGAVPAGVKLLTSNGAHLPYAIVSFGGKSPVAGKNQGIASTALDLKWTSVAVECVAASPRDVRLSTKIVRNLLEGYIPDPDWGELSERLSGDYQVLRPEYEPWPVRHATGIVFNANTNAVTSN